METKSKTKNKDDNEERTFGKYFFEEYKINVKYKNWRCKQDQYMLILCGRMILSRKKVMFLNEK